MKKELKEYIKKNKLSDEDILKLLSSKPTEETNETEETDVKDESEDENESENQSDSNSKKEIDDKKAEKKPALKKEESKTFTQEDIAKLVAEQVEKALKQKKSLPKGNQVDKNFKPNEWGLRTS
jgi:hypothetical protein